MKTKTTFELDSVLLKQLKTTAARSGRSVRDLLTEGAQAVLEKYDAQEDLQELKRRASEAEARFIGSFSGPGNLSANIDQVVYGVREGPPEYSARRSRGSRKPRKK